MNRSQSALEYMMTYGWAILIIVIVAGVLYSFGIFSPPSSVSTTITGFSGVKVTSVAADSSTLALQLMDISGNPVQITQINATSNGRTYTTFSCVNTAIPQGETTNCYVKGNFTTSPAFSSVSIGYISQNVFNTYYASTGKVAVQLSPFLQSSPFPTVSQENNIAYVGSWSGALAEVNLSSGKEIAVLGNPTWGGTQVFVVPNDTMALMPDGWTTLGIFKLPSFQLVKKYWGNGCNHYVTTSPNMEYAFVSVNCGNYINVYNLSSNSYYNFKNIIVQNNPQQLVTASNGNIYTVNQGSQSLSVISTSSLSDIANITNIGMGGGGSPWSVGYDPQNGNLYIPATNWAPGNTFGWNNISIVSTVSNSLVGSIDGLNPNSRQAIVSPNGKYIYVTGINNFYSAGNSNLGTLSIVNASDWVVIKNIVLQENPRGIAVDPSNGNIYVSNMQSNSISVVSNSTLSVISTMTGNGLNQPRALAIANGYLYASNWNGNSVSVFSLSTDAAVTTISVQSNPWRMAVSNNGAYLYVPDYGSGNIAVISTSSNSVSTYIGVGCNPSNIVVVPGSQKAFGTCWNSNQVFIINTTSNTLIQGAFSVTTVGNNLRAIAVSPNGQYIYTGTWSTAEQLVVISTSTDSVVKRVPMPEQASTLSSLFFSPAGSLVGIFGYQSMSPVRIFNPTTLQEERQVGSLVCLGDIAISSDGKYAALPENCRDAISVINLSSGSVMYTARTWWGNAQMATFSPDSKTIYFSTGNAIESLNVSNGLITEYKVAGGCPWWVSTGLNGNHVYLSYGCGTSNFQNMQAGVSIFTPTFNDQTNINDIGMTIGGLALSLSENKLYITNNNGCSFATLSTDTNTIDNYPFSQFCWSPNQVLADGNTAYVLNNGDWQTGDLVVYNLTSDMETAVIKNIGPYPTGMAITSNGQYIYTTSSQEINSPNVNYGNGTLTEVSTSTDSIVGKFLVKGCPGAIRTPVIGDYAIIETQCLPSNGIEFWDIKTNTPAKFLALGGCINGMALNANGTLAFAVNVCNNQINIINMSSQSLITTASGGDMNNPQDIAISSTGKYAYITNWNTNQLSILNISAALAGVSSPFLLPINLTQSINWKSIVIGGGSYSSV